MNLLELLQDARATQSWDKVNAIIPFSRFAGIEFATEDGKAMGIMRFRPQLIGNPMLPALHGGAIGALLETTAVAVVLFATDAVTIPKTVTFTVDYFRPGKPIDTFCAGRVTRMGKRVVNVRVEAWQEDRSRPVSAANATFLVIREQDDKRRDNPG